MPNNKSHIITAIGILGAMAIAIVAISTAWNVIGLPKFALAEDVQELRQFSRDTRVMLLDVILWDASRELSAAERKWEEYTLAEKPIPDWLRKDVLSLKRTINKKQSDINNLN